jgi:transketolase
MRNAFTSAMCELARRDPRILFIVSDIGNITFDGFRAEFPDRFLNVGVAEANMIGVCAGLALCGKIPVAYTIAAFEVFRAFEQIRDDVCYQNLPVKIVGVGGGLAYSTLGPTHHTIEDLAMFRAVPNMTIVSPADPVEARLLALASVECPGPVYIRLGKAGEKTLFPQTHRIEIGKAVELVEGGDVVLVATGLMVGNCLDAAARLRESGISAGVLNVHTIKPLDRDAILAAADRVGLIVTVEEHNTHGGLGGAVAELVAEDAPGVKVKCLGLPDRFCSDYGSQEHLWRNAGLAPDAIAERVRGLLAVRSR